MSGTEPPPDLAAALARFDREACRGTCDVGRYRLRYAAWGDGPTLLLLHGLSDCARSFIPLMARLCGRFRCVAYDLPDGRRDGARVAAYRHADFAADAVALLDHLKVEQAAFLGSSFGATIALRALHDHPDRFAAGILQGGFAHRPLSWPQRALATLLRWSPRRMGELPRRRRMLERGDGPAFAATPPAIWEFFVENSGSPAARAVAWRALALHRVDLRRLLPAIRQPVLLVGGDADRLVPRSFEEAVLKRLPDARRVEFAACGHYPQYTHPDRMADAVVEFLAAVPMEVWHTSCI
jgi:pimeloyl-ACP methyl ester carboxylesterase